MQHFKPSKRAELAEQLEGNGAAAGRRLRTSGGCRDALTHSLSSWNPQRPVVQALGCCFLSHSAHFQPVGTRLSCHCTLSGVQSFVPSREDGGCGGFIFLSLALLVFSSLSLPKCFSSTSSSPPSQLICFQSSVLPMSAVLAGTVSRPVCLMESPAQDDPFGRVHCGVEQSEIKGRTRLPC